MLRILASAHMLERMIITHWLHSTPGAEIRCWWSYSKKSLGRLHSESWFDWANPAVGRRRTRYRASVGYSSCLRKFVAEIVSQSCHHNISSLLYLITFIKMSSPFEMKGVVLQTANYEDVLLLRWSTGPSMMPVLWVNFVYSGQSWSHAAFRLLIMRT